MGLLDWLGLGKKAPPSPPPVVPRRILVSGQALEPVAARLAEYGAIVPPGPEAAFAVAGPVDGWLVVVPPEDLHAHWFHNVANWLRQGEVRLVALSDGAGAPFAYWLTDDDEFGDFLAGWTHDGQTSMAVHVPDNQVARGIGIGLPAETREAALASRGVPRGLADVPVDRLPNLTRVTLKLEALGAQLNPRLESSLPSREHAAANTGD